MGDDETFPWTPSTVMVRAHYVFNQRNKWDIERGSAFDRWLADHDRQVSEKARQAALNANVILAMLDDMLEPMTTHPMTHLPIMRILVKRLRDHVAQYAHE